MFQWRQLGKGELDHELIWLSVSAASLLVGWAWLALGLPWPHCAFRDVTGHRCPSCGATTCFLALRQLDFGAALRANPGACAGFLGIALYDIYGAMVLTCRLPRLRWKEIPPATANWVRGGVAVLLAMNWIYEAAR